MSRLFDNFTVRLAASYVLLLLATVGVLGLAVAAQDAAQAEADLHTRLLGDARAVAVAAAPLLARPRPSPTRRRSPRPWGGPWPPASP